MQGLKIVMAIDPSGMRAAFEDSNTAARMRQAADSAHRRMLRHIERMVTRAMVMQDYDKLDRLYIRDDPYGITGPSVVSALAPVQVLFPDADPT